MGPGRGADWPWFLGPARDGTSVETGLLEKMPTNGPVQLWEKAIGTGYSAPSVRAGRLVVFHRQGDAEIVDCLDAGTGRPIWRSAAPTQFQDPYGYNNGPRCSPVLTTNRCYTFGASGRLRCLDLSSGKAVWERDTAREFRVPEAFFGVGSTPCLEGDRLLVMVGGQPDSGVVALEASTGRTLWESVGSKTWQGRPRLGWPGEPPVEWNSEEKMASYASIIVTTVHGRRIAWCFTRQGLVGLDPGDGKVLFSRWFRARVDESVNAMTPLVKEDLVLLSSAYYRSGSVLLRVKPDGSGLEEVWKGLALEMHWSQPVLMDGFLYGFTGRNEPDAHFRCVDFRTGAVRWDREERFPKHAFAQPPVFGRGSMIVADGKIIALGEGGLLGVFRPSPDRCEELARWQVPHFKHPCWAAPVLSDRRLYLRSEQSLVCYQWAR